MHLPPFQIGVFYGKKVDSSKKMKKMWENLEVSGQHFKRIFVPFSLYI